MNQNKAQCFFCNPYDYQTHSKIENGIVENEFSPDSTWGFRLHSRRQDYLRAVYIEKHTFVERTTDPFGNSTELERVTYNQIDFQVSVKPPHLLIFKPPINYRKLINQLAQLADYTIAIENKNVNLLRWLELLENKNLKGTVIKANIHPINYDNYTTGKLSLASSVDLREKIDKLLSGNSFTIKNLKIVFKNSESIPDVELYRNGKIIFSRPTDKMNFEVFYDAFCKLAINLEL